MKAERLFRAIGLVDEDLIEACIYESRALRARYRYLLRMAREQNVHISPF